MKKNKLKIGDVARELGIKKSIIRQWEQEFNLKTSQQDKQHYSSEDMTVLRTIKDLIRTQGLSLDDAKKQLQSMNPATKYIEEQKEEVHVHTPKKKMTTITIKAKPAPPAPIEKEEEKQQAAPPVEASVEEAKPIENPVEIKPVEVVETKPEPAEVKVEEIKQEAQAEQVDASKDVRNQLSSLKEKLLRFKKLLD